MDMHEWESSFYTIKPVAVALNSVVISLALCCHVETHNNVSLICFRNTCSVATTDLNHLLNLYNSQ